MIPYFEWKVIQLGPITLQVWGLFVAAGFVFGAWMAGKMAKRRGLEPKMIWDMAAWFMIAGLVGGRIGHVLLYDPQPYLADPASIFRIWEGGLSVYGGFIACTIVALWFMRKHKLDVWQYTDVCLFGLPFGYAVGRIGCFLIHDHPGTATDFFLGVKYPDGVTRHDHGLYLSLQAAVLATVFLWISRKERPVGTYISAFCIWYGSVRFVLDFWRVIDVRYLGLTPAQYLSILLIFIPFLWPTNRRAFLKAAQK